MPLFAIRNKDAVAVEGEESPSPFLTRDGRVLLVPDQYIDGFAGYPTVEASDPEVMAEVEKRGSAQVG